MVSELVDFEFKSWSCIFLLRVIFIYKSLYDETYVAQTSRPLKHSGEALTNIK
jgi:hypothetical protein